jgi:hypothetical protein
MLWAMAAPPASDSEDETMRQSFGGGAPRHPDDITARWLSDVTGQMIDRITVERLGIGVGLLGTVARVRLEPSILRADGRPAHSVVVKLPSLDASIRAIVEHFGYERREAGTYRHLLPHPAVPAPPCLAVVDGPAGPVFVFEDLEELRPGDQLVGASAVDALAVAAWAGRLHGAFWNAPELGRHSWLPSPHDPVIADYGRLFALMWPAYVAGPGRSVEPELLAAAEIAMDRFDEVIMSFDDPPLTLVHGDLRLDNVLFRDSSTESRAGSRAEPMPVVLDWQLAAHGRGPYDLAFFAAGSIRSERRRAIEGDLLERYHRELRAAGVADYSLDDVWRDYRRGLVMNLPNPITAIVAVVGGNERGDALLAANAYRALVAVADHLSFLS